MDELKKAEKDGGISQDQVRDLGEAGPGSDGSHIKHSTTSSPRRKPRSCRSEPMEASVSADGSRGRSAACRDHHGRQWTVGAARGLPRTAGHRRGAEAVKTAVGSAVRLGVRYLTLFGFSSENWSRPEWEVSDLMGLLRYYLAATSCGSFKEHAIRLQGDRRPCAAGGGHRPLDRKAERADRAQQPADADRSPSATADGPEIARPPAASPKRRARRAHRSARRSTRQCSPAILYTPTSPTRTC